MYSVFCLDSSNRFSFRVRTDRHTDRQRHHTNDHLKREVELDNKRKRDCLKDALFVDNMIDLLLLVNLLTDSSLILEIHLQFTEVIYDQKSSVS